MSVGALLLSLNLYLKSLMFQYPQALSQLNLKPPVVPVFKSGDKSHPGNYRPISLLSIFDRIFEKRVCKINN